MEKVEVKVCMGTTCFVMGSSNLQGLIESIPRKYKGKAEVTGVTCLGMCSSSAQGEYSKAPYVKVNDVIVQEATEEKVVAEIERQLNEQ